MTDTTDERPYRLLNTLDDLEIPAGTSILVTASEPAGTEFLLRLLAEGRREDENLLVLTTDTPAGDITADIAAAAGDGGDHDGNTRIIDCQTESIAVEDDAVVTQDVNTPRNLTDIGIGFKDAFDDFDAAEIDRTRFGLVSLSVILSYVDQETVYRFCQTLTRGVDQENALGLFLLNIDAHDDGTINTLRRAFDGVMTLDSTDGELSVRLSGIDGIAEDWLTVDE
ncbi:DUF7504 family protein [Haloarcula brevis]|uniref:DUF7504 family protein n=1 Tax=Haloarcula brevis TaxID=3111453 RepID=UPI00300F3FD6